jgi:hypothetical protein
LDPDPDLDPDPYWPPTSSSGSGSVKNEYGSTTLVFIFYPTLEAQIFAINAFKACIGKREIIYLYI